MIDLILHCNAKSDLRAFAIANNLMREVMETVVDPETGERSRQGTGEYKVRPGVEWCWWAGSGKMLRRAAVVDSEGNETTPGQYVNGFVAILRISGEMFRKDKTDDGTRHKVIRYIKNNGTEGTAAGLTYFEIDGVRMFRPEDVNAKLQEWGVPGHQWLGGNVLAYDE